jgi:hypothetical protein
MWDYRRDYLSITHVRNNLRLVNPMDLTTPQAGVVKRCRLAERHDALLNFESTMIGCGLLWRRPY